MSSTHSSGQWLLVLTYFLTSLIAGINMTIYNYKIGHFPDITSLGTFLSKIQPWCKFITANHTQSSNYIIARSITFAIQLSYVTILQCSSTYIVGPLSFLLPLEYCHLSLFPLFFFFNHKYFLLKAMKLSNNHQFEPDFLSNIGEECKKYHVEAIISGLKRYALQTLELLG